MNSRVDGAPDLGTRPGDLSLLCRVQSRLCALPLEHVVETMRPLPIEALPAAPSFVRGLAIVRGTPIPVVDAARLLGAGEARPTRFVSVKVAGRRVALAVDGVIGVQRIPPESVQELPPLLQEAGADIVSAIARLDADLLLVLRSARLLAESWWDGRDPMGSPP